MTPEMRKAQEAYRAEQDEIENIKKRVITEPLTFGGKINDPDQNTATDQNIGRRDPTYNFGSTLYDFIALHPAKKSLSADFGSLRKHSTVQVKYTVRKAAHK